MMARHLPAEADDETTIALVPRFWNRDDLALRAIRVSDLLLQLRGGIEQVLCLKAQRELIRYLVVDGTIQIAGRLLPDRQSDAAIDRCNEEP